VGTAIDVEIKEASSRLLDRTRKVGVAGWEQGVAVHLAANRLAGLSGTKGRRSPWSSEGEVTLIGDGSGQGSRLGRMFPEKHFKQKKIDATGIVEGEFKECTNPLAAVSPDQKREVGLDFS